MTNYWERSGLYSGSEMRCRSGNRITGATYSRFLSPCLPSTRILFKRAKILCYHRACRNSLEKKIIFGLTGKRNIEEIKSKRILLRENYKSVYLFRICRTSRWTWNCRRSPSILTHLDTACSTPRRRQSRDPADSLLLEDQPPPESTRTYVAAALRKSKFMKKSSNSFHFI